MAGANIFHIDDGWVGLVLVDTAAIGYSADWQAPMGASVDEVSLTDYGSPGGVDNWACQITSGTLTPTANENTVEVPATFCQPAESIPQPGVTSYALDVEFLQDPNVVDGLTAYLFEHDTKEAYFALGLNAEGTPPATTGRVRLIAGAFGGPARANLVTTLSLPVVRKPDMWVGDVAPGRVINGDGTPPVVQAASTSSSKKDDKEPVPA